MVNLITALVAICLAAAGLWLVLRARRREPTFNATVSREWLIHHQGDSAHE